MFSFKLIPPFISFKILKMKFSFLPFVIGELGFRDFLKKQPSCRDLPLTTSSSGFTAIQGSTDDLD